MRSRNPIPFLLLLLIVPGSVLADLVPDWSEASFEPLAPVDLPCAGNPVFSRFNMPAFTVADPFLFHHQDRWWLFFEVMPAPSGNGNIALATSLDGVHWTFDRVLLDTEDQLSYPLVFRWEETFYLMPDRYPTPGVAIYRCSEEAFPYGWEPAAEILTDRVVGDATLFRHADRWWILASHSGSGTCFLWHAEEFLDPKAWCEHPMSPIAQDDRSRARPAGRVLHLAGDRLIRLAQRSNVVYGEAVRAFEILQLDTEVYAEAELPESPVLGPGAAPWNAERMHHLDAWWTGDRWLCAVDGHDGTDWSIGIFSDCADPTSTPPSGAGGLALRVNAGERPVIVFHLPDERALRLTIHDVSGRVLCELIRERGAAGPHRRTWDGREGNGRLIASGLYLARLKAGRETAAAKVLLLR